MDEVINTKEKLINYCLRKLGHPVIQINVTLEQCIDRVNEALLRYYEFHCDGSQRLYLKHRLTDEDLANGYIKLPKQVMSVVQVLNASLFQHFNMNNLSHIAWVTDVVNGAIGMNGISNYVRTMSYLKTLENMLSPEHSVRFVKYGDKLRFDGEEALHQFRVGNILVIQVYYANTAEEYPDTYNDYWLKRYCTALIKYQWGSNLIKYDGFSLPNGMTINGDKILQEAKENMTALEEELRTTWFEPVLPLMG